VARECGFSKIHIFPFSPRKGTPAAEMAGNVPPQVKAERAARLAEVERELREAYFRSLVGRRLTVLVEGPSDQTPGAWAGTSCRYAPVEISGGEELVPGTLVGAMAIGVADGATGLTASL
jgi:threonylcarbamoyladenosine tRNA methylthiotransferase MtaB